MNHIKYVVERQIAKDFIALQSDSRLAFNVVSHDHAFVFLVKFGVLRVIEQSIQFGWEASLKLTELGQNCYVDEQDGQHYIWIPIE